MQFSGLITSGNGLRSLAKLSKPRFGKLALVSVQNKINSTSAAAAAIVRKICTIATHTLFQQMF